MLQFYFFGVPENDSVLNGDTSMAVTLSENFYFYDQTVRVLYVSYVHRPSSVVCIK